MRQFIERGYLIVDSSGVICELYVGTRNEALRECERQAKVIDYFDTFTILGNSIPVYSVKEEEINKLMDAK